MARKGRVAIARYRRATSETRLVALLPQPRKVDEESGAVALPGGLYVIQLPFAEDLRELKLEPSMAESAFEPAELEASRNLVRALQLPTAPVASVANPLLHKHFSYLRALATSEKGGAAPTTDSTLPDAAFLNEHSAQIRSFREAFELPTDFAAGGGGGGAKKPKVDKVGPPTCLADWIALWQAGDLKSQTAPILKALCKEEGLAVGGKKDDLIRRVHDHLTVKAAEDSAARAGDGAAVFAAPET